MNIGKKIFELRRSKRLSQEELGERIGVTRQTISNWELNETVPNIEQLIKISKEFNISIDELVNNNLDSIITNKVSNTERLAGLILKFIKIIFIIIIIFIILFIVFFIIGFYPNKLNDKDLYKTNIKCTINGKKYNYQFIAYADGKIKYAGGDDYIVNIADTEKYDYVDVAINRINFAIKEKNGKCIVDKK